VHTPRGNPNVAAVLSWLLPGAGQLYVGSVLPALVSFAVVEGLYWLGLRLSGGMTFEYLEKELHSAVTPLLSPELGNLGAILYQIRVYGFGPGTPRVWPDHIVMGSMLCALSGVLGICVAVHAHSAARTSQRPKDPKRWIDWPAVAVGLAWLVPGLAHFLQGRKRRAAIVLVLLVGLFALGTVLAEGSNLSRERHFYYWAGQFMVGLPAILAEGLFGHLRVKHEIPYVDAGLVFACVAGLLNILAMIDAYGFSESRFFGLPFKSSAPSEPAAPAVKVG
jgi:TM2 domain-containing membrane protein YozV